jgi:hypothetical protein
MNDKSAGDPDRLSSGLRFDSVQPDNGSLQCHIDIYHPSKDVIPVEGEILSQGAGFHLQAISKSGRKLDLNSLACSPA